MLKISFRFYKNLTKFVVNLATKIARPVSMLGLFLIIIMFLQCISGIMLAFSLLGEPMLVPMSRSEEEMEDRHIDDFFWIHERGVDFIFITLYLHFLRKFYLNAYSHEQEMAWKSGALAFLLTHGVIFFGLVLCATHLSDVTLKIAANIMLTFVKKKINIHWWLFTDKALNTDSLIRMMYAHYCLAFLLVYVSVCHALAMHYDWKDSQLNNNSDVRLKWFFDLLRAEMGSLIKFFLIFAIISKYLYSDIEPLHNELFTFGDVGIILDVRYLGVMPHWYFRGYMGWLILVPQHYIGIFGLIIFMVIIYFQPNLKKKYFDSIGEKKTPQNISNISLVMMWIYVIALFFCDSLLPYGRFFSRVGGHKSLTLSYFIVFIYLIIPTKYIIFNELEISKYITLKKEENSDNLKELQDNFYKKLYPGFLKTKNFFLNKILPLLPKQLINFSYKLVLISLKTIKRVVLFIKPKLKAFAYECVDLYISLPQVWWNILIKLRLH